MKRCAWCGVKIWQKDVCDFCAHYEALLRSHEGGRE